MNWLVRWIEATGFAPFWFLVLFVLASLIMIWRLEAMSAGGLEGTVLGTLVMPYCSGIGNLIFAFLVAMKGGAGREVLTNALVNNVTNLTLLLGLPAIFWRMSVLPAEKAQKSKKKKTDKQVHKINRLSLLLTLTAAVFFTGVMCALASDGALTFTDGVVMIGLFLFWQAFHVYDVLKTNVQQNKTLGWTLIFDFALLAMGAYGIYLSTNWLVDWLSNIHTGFISAEHLGWLSGWLMVLPNALLAIYYARRGNPEVVYTSQVGDGHISIPLSVGIFTLFRTIQVPAFFYTGAAILMTTAVIHFVVVALFGSLPRFMGWVLVAAYLIFLFTGLGQ